MKPAPQQFPSALHWLWRSSPDRLVATGPDVLSGQGVFTVIEEQLGDAARRLTVADIADVFAPHDGGGPTATARSGASSTGT
ncbi:hypothetical protein FKR81_37555 [Lentzea tibetensis]|uniref:Uncharacterized protein n=1 Tax=Lentzea tibetensis TaxID=2591470 RepID=A0A563EHJ4_9PSEU|nr:hypothetical protein [Lentzea tibetensis]TWP46076.1 hypothetical protein FKR81_37555 [Lentzea tibetensis]